MYKPICCAIFHNEDLDNPLMLELGEMEQQVQELADNQCKSQATQSKILEKLSTLSKKKKVTELTTKAKVPVTPAPISSWDVEDANNETWNMDNEWSWNIESEEEISPDTCYDYTPQYSNTHTHVLLVPCL